MTVRSHAHFQTHPGLRRLSSSHCHLAIPDGNSCRHQPSLFSKAYVPPLLGRHHVILDTVIEAREINVALKDPAF
jgi:hypothetical protein